MGILTKYKLTIGGLLVGGIVGYLYYHYVGCMSGSCPITSRPLNSTLYGAGMGGLLFNMFRKDKKSINSNMRMTRTIVDVRTPSEFRGGHVDGSVNIPLSEIPNRLSEIKKLAQPIILCCASGGRSGQATTYLKALGVLCENGGSWQDVNFSYQQ